MKEGQAFPASVAPAGTGGVEITDVVDRGEVLNSRANHSYYANRAQTVSEGDDFHLFFCGSGKPYIHGEGPAWWWEDYDQQQYARDKLFYKKSRGLMRTGQGGDAEVILEAGMVEGLPDGSPFYGPENWREDFKESACISSTVYYHGHYYTFFEKQHYVEHSPTTDKELLGIGVARTVDGAKPDVGVVWEVLGDDGTWRIPSPTVEHPRKSVIVPAIMRVKYGSKKSEDHVLNNDYAVYNGASAPCALVVNDVLYVYYTDDTHHLALLWEWREVYAWKPPDNVGDGFSGSGNVLPPEDSPFFGRLDFVEEDEWPDEPRSYAKYRVSFRHESGEVDFFSNAGEIDLDVDNLGVENSAEMVTSPGYRGGFAPHQKMRFTDDIPGGAFIVFIVEPDPIARVVRIQYLKSADGLLLEDPVDCGYLDYDDARYTDGTLDVSADWEGHLSFGRELLFTYPRHWNYQMEVPVSDLFSHFYTGPLYAGGWNLYAFSCRLRWGTPKPDLRVPADRPEDVFSDPRVRVDGTRRQDNWLFLHADRNGLSTEVPAVCCVFREDGEGNVSLVSETTLPHIWGPDEEGWFTYSVHAADMDTLLAQPGYFATLKVAHASEPMEFALVAIPLSGDEDFVGGYGHNFRPVSVHTIIPWVVPGDPDNQATGVYFVGMFHPKAYDGKLTRIRLHWQAPEGPSQPPEEYPVIDIETRPPDYWGERFLHAFVGKHSWVYYINLPKTAESSVGSFRGDQDHLVAEGWSCVAEILDGNNSSKDRLFVPLTTGGF